MKRAHRLEAIVNGQADIERGPRPGAAGLVIHSHATYYHRHWGFDVTFETQVGRELCEFLSRYTEERDGFWTAWAGAVFAGAVAVDGSGYGALGARLRWFIVDESFQGKGLGRALLAEAVAFARSSEIPRLFLWTFKGLDAARRLYEQAGFVLTEEREAAQWGGVIREQKFELVFL